MWATLESVSSGLLIERHYETAQNDVSQKGALDPGGVGAGIGLASGVMSFGDSGDLTGTCFLFASQLCLQGLAAVPGSQDGRMVVASPPS